jgi:hypothetical protein
MDADQIDILVLTTVNAPYRLRLDAGGLIECLNDPAKMRAAAGPMSSFFYDVGIDLQRRFAEAHGIQQSALESAANLFDSWSGQHWAGDRAA